MENFIYPGILSGIALLVYYFTLAKSGMARQKYKIPAPLHEGPIGRLGYAYGYYKDAEKRVLGLYISMPPIYIFVVGSLVGFLIKIFGS